MLTLWECCLLWVLLSVLFSLVLSTQGGQRLCRFCVPTASTGAEIEDAVKRGEEYGRTAGPAFAELRVCAKAWDCSTPNARISGACIESGVAGFPAWGSDSTRDREAQYTPGQVGRRRPGCWAEAEL